MTDTGSAVGLSWTEADVSNNLGRLAGFSRASIVEASRDSCASCKDHKIMRFCEFRKNFYTDNLSLWAYKDSHCSSLTTVILSAHLCHRLTYNC